jgi:hypothetical protein
MFGFFKRKPPAPPAKPPRRLPLVSEMTEQHLIESIRGTFANSHVTVAALFLVAHENFNTWFSVFCTHAPGPVGDYPATLDGLAHYLARSSPVAGRAYPATLEGIVAFLADSHAQFTTDSVYDEVNSRRFFYLYMAGLLRRLHALAKAKPELWDAVADIWIPLLEGGRALRATLDRTSLWKPDELEYFAHIHNEDEGELYVEAHMMPAEVRYHAKVKDWRDRDLTPEQRAELDADMKKLFGE